MDKSTQPDQNKGKKDQEKNTQEQDQPISPEVRDGQKAIAVHKQVNDEEEKDEKKDAEQWRNEG